MNDDAKKILQHCILLQRLKRILFFLRSHVVKHAKNDCEVRI